MGLSPALSCLGWRIFDVWLKLIPLYPFAWSKYDNLSFANRDYVLQMGSQAVFSGPQQASGRHYTSAALVAQRPPLQSFEAWHREACERWAAMRARKRAAGNLLQVSGAEAIGIREVVDRLPARGKAVRQGNSEFTKASQDGLLTAVFSNNSRLTSTTMCGVVASTNEALEEPIICDKGPDSAQRGGLGLALGVYQEEPAVENQGQSHLHSIARAPDTTECSWAKYLIRRTKASKKAVAGNGEGSYTPSPMGPESERIQRCSLCARQKRGLAHCLARGHRMAPQHTVPAVPTATNATTSAGADGVVEIGATVEVLFDDGVWYSGSVLRVDISRQRNVVRFADGFEDAIPFSSQDLRRPLGTAAADLVPASATRSVGQLVPPCRNPWQCDTLTGEECDEELSRAGGPELQKPAELARYAAETNWSCRSQGDQLCSSPQVCECSPTPSCRFSHSIASISASWL